MSKKQINILTILFFLILIVLSISTAFAWFANFKINTESKENKVSSATTETIIFNAGNPINIQANDDNFSENKPSLEATTNCSVTLQSGSTNYALTNYDIKLFISKNNFLYTIDPTKPELLLIIKDPQGNIVDNVPGLTFVKTLDYQGFDITRSVGGFVIASNQVIETNSYLTHEWEVSVVFVNYDEKQDANRGKSLVGYLAIGKSGELV